MNRRLASFASVLTVLLAASTAHAQDGPLRYKWVKGADVRYRFLQETRSAITGIPDAPAITVEQTMAYVVRQMVDDVAADGTVTLRQTFESARMEMTSPAGHVALDAATQGKAGDPATEGIGKVLAAMLGEAITVTIAPSGAVTKVEGMGRIVDKILATLPDSPGTTMMATQLKATMGDDAMRRMVEQGFVLFPDHPPAVGESWTRQFETTNPMIGGMTTTKTSTFNGIDRANGTALARISLTLDIKPKPGSPTQGLGGMSMTMADSRGQGEILFDVAKGQVQKTTVATDIAMTMSMAGPDGQTINAQNVGRSTVTMELVEK